MSNSNTNFWSLLVKELRQRLNLSQESFAHRLGVSFQTVNRWETGRAIPSPMASKLIKQQLIELGNEGEDLLNQYFPESKNKELIP